jgi:hypothetical protein
MHLPKTKMIDPALSSRGNFTRYLHHPDGTMSESDVLTRTINRDLQNPFPCGSSETAGETDPGIELFSAISSMTSRTDELYLKGLF